MKNRHFSLALLYSGLIGFISSILTIYINYDIMSKDLVFESHEFYLYYLTDLFMILSIVGLLWALFQHYKTATSKFLIGVPILLISSTAYTIIILYSFLGNINTNFSLRLLPPSLPVIALVLFGCITLLSIYLFFHNNYEK